MTYTVTPAKAITGKLNQSTSGFDVQIRSGEYGPRRKANKESRVDGRELLKLRGSKVDVPQLAKLRVKPAPVNPNAARASRQRYRLGCVSRKGKRTIG